MQRLITQTLDPMLSAYFRDIAHKKTMLELLHDRDRIQAYCDVLETKWILSERAGADVGLDAAVTDYIGLGAPAPESARGEGSDVDTISAEDALVSAAVSAADEDASR